MEKEDNPKRQFGRKKILLLLLLVAALLTGSLFVTNRRYMRRFGTLVKPPADYPLVEVNYYLQRDSRWANDHLGDSKYKMGGYGCLIMCVAASLNHLGIATDPKELNRQLTAVDGYVNGDLLWAKIHEAYPAADYRSSHFITGSYIEKDLNSGLLPLINVKYHHTGITHWVLIVGAQDGEFLIYDPANSKLTYLPLSVHGRIYAYRVIIPAE